MEETPTASRQLSPQVQAQLAAMPALDTPTFWERVEIRDSNHTDYLASEVLVKAFRDLLVVDAVDAAQRVAGELLERWGQWVARRVQRLCPASQDLQLEARQEVHLNLWRELTNPTRKFWEINFIHCLWQLLHKHTLRLREREEERAQHQCAFTSPVEDEAQDEDVEPVDDKSPSIIEELLRAEDNARLARALASLPEKQAQAAYLRYVRDLQVENDDPNETTVSRVMDLTGRMVRTHLRRAEASLRDWYMKERANGRA